MFPCYAYKLAHGRLRNRYLYGRDWKINYDPSKQGYTEACLDPFYPRFWRERIDIDDSYNRITSQKPKGIFVCDMGELFGDWLPEWWQDQVFLHIRAHPQHRFYLLTKQPQNLIKFSPFPDNCRVGGTATDAINYTETVRGLAKIIAEVKFISFEPLLDNPIMLGWGIDKPPYDWVIIGACTGRKQEIFELSQRYFDLAPMPYGRIWTAQPRIEWVEEIVRACDKAGVKVFLKDNLKPLILSHAQDKDTYWAEYILDKGGLLRQELPNVTR